jgi:hypothetical protein
MAAKEHKDRKEKQKAILSRGLEFTRWMNEKRTIHPMQVAPFAFSRG